MARPESVVLKAAEVVPSCGDGIPARAAPSTMVKGPRAVGGAVRSVRRRQRAGCCHYGRDRGEGGRVGDGFWVAPVALWALAR